MQGGHGDKLRVGFLNPKTDNDGDTSGYESELSVVTTGFNFGHHFDSFVHYLREAFALALAWPIAFLNFYPTLQSFRKNQLRLVEDGTQTVVRLQSTCRSPFMDKYCQVFSFFAEEEFYLLILPLLFWNWDYVLGRRLTLVVCSGLGVGNILKDVFAFPRPESPPVWRPSDLDNIDSTHLQDFGFPSTHSMNAVSNSLFVAFYLTAATESHLYKFCTMMIVLWYASSLCFSRLYLGAHTPTDVRGGIILGLLVFFAHWEKAEAFENYYMSTTYLSFKLFCFGTILLLLNPQPRPVTPTFAQNALIYGLIWGCMQGSRWFNDLGSFSATISKNSEVIFASNNIDTVIHSSILVNVYTFFHSLSVNLPYVAAILRLVLGFTIVLVFRLVVKSGTIMMLSKVFNIHVKPKLVAEDYVAMKKKDDDLKEKAKKKGKVFRKRVVRLFTRDIDIVGNAIVKVSTYTITAMGITFIVPVVLEIIGLGIH